MSTPANIVVDLSRTYGQVLVSTIIATALWGMACMQMLLYFVTYESDRWYMKGLVVVLWLLDTLHEVFCILGLWNYLIPKFGDLSVLATVQPALMYQVAVTGVVAAIAQCFFIWRIWRFSDNNWIFPIILIPPTIGQMVGFIIYSTKGIGQPVTFLGTKFMSNLGFGLCVTITAVDVLIAITMCFLLWRGRTGLLISDRVMLRLMNASVNTGVCTAVFGLVASITLGIWPEELYYALGEIPICPLYCNAVLANLNSRKYIRGANTTVHVASAHGQSSGRGMPLTPMGGSSIKTRRESEIIGKNGERDLEGRYEFDARSAVAVHVETTKAIHHY